MNIDYRSLFFENWQIKLVSLVLAVFLWFYVTSTGQTEIAMSVPLELRNVPQGMVVVGNVASKVEVRFQGQDRPLREIATSRRVAATIDLSQAREGENRIHITPDDIRRPSGVLVTHIAPYEITVRLERLVQKRVRLRPVLVGYPATGYRLAGTTVSPPWITIEGPASVVRTFSHLQTMPIDISGQTGDVTVEPRIDYRGKPVKVLEQGIRVTVDLKKERP